jgi:hypothetical protein
VLETPWQQRSVERPARERDLTLFPGGEKAGAGLDAEMGARRLALRSAS